MPDVMRAAAFADGIGVNAHLVYTDSRYANVGNVISDLKYLGVTYIRAGAIGSTNQGQASFGTVADAGIKIDMVAQPGRDPDALVKAVATWSVAHPGALVAIEGPNEINNWPVKYAGLTGTAAGIAYQNALNTAVRQTDSLDHVATYGLTGANAETSSDYANFHAYPKKGAEPYNTLVNGLRTQTTAMSGKPVVLTELGYYTAPQSSNWGGVDQLAQSKLTLNALLDATKLGISRTYLYQLLDPYTDPSGVSIDKNLGLFDLSNRPKLAATAIHNMTTLLADHASNALSFDAHPINFTLSNMPDTGSSLQYEKSTGEHDIVLWAEPDIWDETNHTGIAAPSKSVKIDFGSNHYSVAIFDPLVSATKPQKTYSDTTSVTLHLKDHPLIIELFDSQHSSVAVHNTALSSNIV